MRLLYKQPRREPVSTPDAQPSRLLPRRPQVITPSSLPSDPVPDVPNARNSEPYPPVTPLLSSLPTRPSPSTPRVAQPEQLSYEHAIDFATQSWDLKTGGMKTLTAKRELPTRPDRRSADFSQDVREASSTRNYMFAMIVLVCVIFMLIGGGVILFVILQP